jgi:hypothetical protein
MAVNIKIRILWGGRLHSGKEICVWRKLLPSFQGKQAALLLPQRWRQQDPPKRWCPSISIHGVTFQKIEILFQILRHHLYMNIITVQNFVNYYVNLLE